MLTYHDNSQSNKRPEWCPYRLEIICGVSPSGIDLLNRLAFQNKPVRTVQKRGGLQLQTLLISCMQLEIRVSEQPRMPAKHNR